MLRAALRLNKNHQQRFVLLSHVYIFGPAREGCYTPAANLCIIFRGFTRCCTFRLSSGTAKDRTSQKQGVSFNKACRQRDLKTIHGTCGIVAASEAARLVLELLHLHDPASLTN